MFEVLTFIASILGLVVIKPKTIKLFFYKILLIYIMIVSGIQTFKTHEVFISGLVW